MGREVSRLKTAGSLLLVGGSHAPPAQTPRPSSQLDRARETAGSVCHAVPMVDIGDLLLGGVVGVAVGVPLGALIRPPAANLERFARRLWRYDPLIVHVERDPSIIWSGEPDWMPFSLYCKDPLSLSDPPEGRDEWLTWGRELGCVDAYMTQLKVTLQAKTDVAVIVEGLRISHHKKPVETGLILTRATGGADLDPRRFNIDLDWRNPPVVTFVGAGGQPAATPSMKLSAGDLVPYLGDRLI
jgi:hypothetical protein